MPPSKLSRLTAALLLGALVLAGVTAAQAHDAVHARQAAAARTLRGYAAISAWEVATHLRQDLLSAHFSLFAPVTRALGEARLDTAGAAPGAGARAGAARRLPLPADSLAELLADQAELCACAPGVRFYFRVDLAPGAAARPGGLDVRPAAGAPDLTPALRRWVRDTVVAFAEARARLAAREAAGAGDRPEGGRAPAPLVVRLPSGRELARAGLLGTYASAALYRASAEAPLAAVVLVARAAGGRPLVAYGVGVDPEAYLAPVLAGVLAKPRLLPPALTSAPAGRPAAPAGAGATAAALPAAPAPLALRVRDGAGRPLYASPAPFAWRYHAAEVLDDAYGGLRVDVALDPAVAEAAVPGGSPEAPLPVPLALFALTAGLIAVAVLQLRRQDELARMRADFVSGVSHELRTPLAQIRLLAELLHLGRPAHEEGRQRAARVIDQEARRLSYLVENVLAFSRGERGATRLLTAPLDVAEAAAEVVELFAPLAAAAGARVALRAEPGAVASVDGGALRQVLLNFLDNAARYGPRGQTVEVGVARAAAPGGGVCVRVWVQDEGPGVPPAERARVWAPYYRLERDAAATRGGSGIGLAVVRDLVARQGGAVRVEAATRANAAGGRGARFVAEFPAPPPGARPEAAAAAPPAPTDYLRARLRERTPVHTAAAPRPAPNVAPGAGAGAGA